MTDKYLTTNQVAAHLQVSRTTLWRWEKNGTLKPVVVGGVKRYTEKQINPKTK